MAFNFNDNIQHLYKLTLREKTFSREKTLPVPRKHSASQETFDKCLILFCVVVIVSVAKMNDRMDNL